MECFFDATTVDPLDSGFAPLPEGEYEAMIVKSQNKPTKSGSGSYLELQLQVVSGEYKKRTLWARLNLKNANPTAVEIAKRELSSICHATGVLRPATKEALHNIPMIVRVVKVPGERGEQNEIKGYKAKSAAAQPAQAAAPAPAAAQTPTGAGERPW